MKENVKVMYRITFPSKRRLKDKGKEKVNIKDNYHKKEAKKVKKQSLLLYKVGTISYMKRIYYF